MEGELLKSLLVIDSLWMPITNLIQDYNSVKI
jgi:hypothetical protein